MMIAGGIGITPMLSIIDEFAQLYKTTYQHEAAESSNTHDDNTKKAHPQQTLVLVWSVRDADVAESIFIQSIKPQLNELGIMFDENTDSDIFHLKKASAVDDPSVIKIIDEIIDEQDEKEVSTIQKDVVQGDNNDTKQQIDGEDKQSKDSSQSISVSRMESSADPHPINPPITLRLNITATKNNEDLQSLNLSIPTIWKPGRINLDTMFNETAEMTRTLQGNRVAVLVCGTTSLLADVKDRCNATYYECGCTNNTAQQVHFDCHEKNTFIFNELFNVFFFNFMNFILFK
jgi:hypothetical protein